MAVTVSDFLVRRLQEWGVRQLFGYSGDGINGILGALDRAGNNPRFIQVRHEETAALMACAHAKFTGETGVCLATQGPGAIHLLNGLYDARLDHQPVVAIVGQVARESAGGRYQQEVDLPTLFKDVAGAFLGVVNDAEQARHVIDRAMRIASAERAVTCVIVPHDVQSLEAVPDPPVQHGYLHSVPGYSPPRVLPRDEDLDRAAAVLNAGERVAILIGQGAMGAGAEVTEAAELLGAGVAKALLGKAALPDDLPFVTGSVGWLGTSASNQMMERCDTLLMVGSGFPYTEFLPKPGEARDVQIDINPGILGVRYPMEVMLAGDSAETLRALIPLLQRKTDRSWRNTIETWTRAWWEDAEERARQTGALLNPRRLFVDLNQRLPDRAIVTADSGTGTVWYARELQFRAGMMGSVSGTLATMGCAIPYALAAKNAHPDRPAIAIVGDGAMQMSGLTELVTVAKEWRNWRDPRLAILVLNNRDLNYVTWEQRAMAGEPKFAPSQEIPDVRYAEVASLLGLNGVRVEQIDEIDPAWEMALTGDRPTVIDAVVDPDVPTLPPALRPETIEKLTKALEQEPDAGAVWSHLSAEGIETPAGLNR